MHKKFKRVAWKGRTLLYLIRFWPLSVLKLVSTHKNVTLRSYKHKQDYDAFRKLRRASYTGGSIPTLCTYAYTRVHTRTPVYIRVHPCTYAYIQRAKWRHAMPNGAQKFKPRKWLRARRIWHLGATRQNSGFSNHPVVRISQDQIYLRISNLLLTYLIGWGRST